MNHRTGNLRCNRAPVSHIMSFNKISFFFCDTTLYYTTLSAKLCKAGVYLFSQFNQRIYLLLLTLCANKTQLRTQFGASKMKFALIKRLSLARRFGIYFSPFSVAYFMDFQLTISRSLHSSLKFETCKQNTCVYIIYQKKRFKFSTENLFKALCHACFFVLLVRPRRALILVTRQRQVTLHTFTARS